MEETRTPRSKAALEFDILTAGWKRIDPHAIGALKYGVLGLVSGKDDGYLEQQVRRIYRKHSGEVQNQVIARLRKVAEDARREPDSKGPERD